MFTLITSYGMDDLSPQEGWGEVPVHQRPTWSRYMLDYMPWFPGVISTVSYVAPGILAGGAGAPAPWKQLARDLSGEGFNPLDYYVLCESLDLRLRAGQLTEDRHGDLFEKWGSSAHWGFVPRAGVWSLWLDHIRAGRSPRRATDYMLSGGNPAPLGYAVSAPGTLGSPIED